MTDGWNIFVAGQTGGGKSYFVKRRIAQARRLVVYLPKAEDRSYPGVYFDCRAGEGPEMVHWWQAARKRCGRYRIVIRPADKFDANEFDRVCRLVYAAGDCQFVAEEIGGYLSSRIFQSVGKYQGIKDLITAGRTRGVIGYWICQRPFGIPREVTSEAREAYIFGLREPADLDYVQDRFGIEARLMMDRLQQYEYVRWLNTGKVRIDGPPRTEPGGQRGDDDGKREVRGSDSRPGDTVRPGDAPGGLGVAGNVRTEPVAKESAGGRPPGGPPGGTN